MGQEKPQKEHYKRQTIFIKRQIQFRYMAVIFLSVIVGFLIFGFEIIWNLSRLFSERPALLVPLLGEIKLIIPFFLVKITIYLIIVLIAAGVISHKLAGPLYKFEKGAAKVGSGDLTHRIYLRKGDHLTDLQKEFNSMISAIHGKVFRGCKTADEISAELKNIAASAADENIKNKLNENAQKLSGISKEFKL